MMNLNALKKRYLRRILFLCSCGSAIIIDKSFLNEEPTDKSIKLILGSCFFSNSFVANKYLIPLTFSFLDLPVEVSRLIKLSKALFTSSNEKYKINYPFKTYLLKYSAYELVG